MFLQERTARPVRPGVAAPGGVAPLTPELGERVAALSAVSQQRLADDIRAVEARMAEVPPGWRPSGVDAPLTRRAITPSMAQVAEEVVPPERVAPGQEAPVAPETELQDAA